MRLFMHCTCVLFFWSFQPSKHNAVRLRARRQPGLCPFPPPRVHEAGVYASNRVHRTNAQRAPRKPVVWEDLTTGKFHAVVRALKVLSGGTQSAGGCAVDQPRCLDSHVQNNETGEHVPCDRSGRPLPQFHLNISGTASTSERLKLRLKDTALNKSLMSTAPARPDIPRGSALAKLREERVETKGRIGIKLPSEAALFVTQQQQMRVTHPEIEAERREEEAKARHKIEELHKNYAALQASSEAGAAATVDTGVREIKNISRSELYSFTSTGVFRP